MRRFSRCFGNKGNKNHSGITERAKPYEEESKRRQEFSFDLYRLLTQTLSPKGKARGQRKTKLRLLFDKFQWKYVAPLISRFQRQQAAEAALNGSSARKAPQGEAYEIGWPFLPKKILQAKFSAGKGKPWRKTKIFQDLELFTLGEETGFGAGRNDNSLIIWFT